MAPAGRRRVYVVGAGPGDPELLTVKARRILKEAEVVVYDRLVAPEILAVANPAADLVYAGKREGEQETVQAWILEKLVEQANAGRLVVRLKGGDPCVFGRGGEEVRRLRELGVESELVPGLSSAIAVPELAGIPVTFRGVSRGFAVVTGHCPSNDSPDWASYARIDTLVILMGVGRRDSIALALIAAGRDPEEPVAFVERGSTPEERVTISTLEEVARGNVQAEAPAVFVVGRVVNLRCELLAALEPALAFPDRGIPTPEFR